MQRLLLRGAASLAELGATVGFAQKYCMWGCSGVGQRNKPCIVQGLASDSPSVTVLTEQIVSVLSFFTVLWQRKKKSASVTEYAAQRMLGVDVSTATFLTQCQFDVSQRWALTVTWMERAEEMREKEDDDPDLVDAPELRMQVHVAHR